MMAPYVKSTWKLTCDEKKFINELADKGKVQTLLNLRVAYSKKTNWEDMDREVIVRHLTRTLEGLGFHIVRRTAVN